MANASPIGIIDSGVGGFTVVKEIINILPNENLIYLGDTGRVPYGTRDNETIKKFAVELVRFLKKQDVKAIVVACNTMSAVSLSSIADASNNTPVIDVIKPTVEFAVSQKEINNIGVIGTRATINSGAYQQEILSLEKSKKVYVKSCPLFVPIVEEGYLHNEASEIIAQDYLSYFDDKNLDLLILGCTHYPMLELVIRKVLRRRIKIVDSASPTAKKLKETLIENNLLNSENKKPEYKFYVTDNPKRSFEIANMFFNCKFPGKIEKIIL